MRKVTTIENFQKTLSEFPLVLAYFTSSNCNVCKVLKPKIEMLTEEHFPDVKFIEVASDEALKLAANYSVFSSPIILFFVDGREYIRESRNVSVKELETKMDKIVRMYQEM